MILKYEVLNFNASFISLKITWRDSKLWFPSNINFLSHEWISSIFMNIKLCFKEFGGILFNILWFKESFLTWSVNSGLYFWNFLKTNQSAWKICHLQICEIFRLHQPIKFQIFCYVDDKSLKNNWKTPIKPNHMYFANTENTMAKAVVKIG